MNVNENGSASVTDAPAAGGGDRRPRFGGDSGFQNELRRRVEQYFRDTGPRQRHRPGLPRPALAAPAAALVPPLAAPLPVGAVRLADDQLAALRRFPHPGPRADRRLPLPAAEGLGPRDLRRRQAGLLLPGV